MTSPAPDSPQQRPAEDQHRHPIQVGLDGQVVERCAKHRGEVRRPVGAARERLLADEQGADDERQRLSDDREIPPLTRVRHTRKPSRHRRGAGTRTATSERDNRLPNGIQNTVARCSPLQFMKSGRMPSDDSSLRCMPRRSRRCRRTRPGRTKAMPRSPIEVQTEGDERKAQELGQQVLSKLVQDVRHDDEEDGRPPLKDRRRRTTRGPTVTAALVSVARFAPTDSSLHQSRRTDLQERHHHNEHEHFGRAESRTAG